MKKEFILAGLLAVGFASAQTTDPYAGRVGINTETPSATLNIKSLTGTDATTKNFELENANGSKMLTVLDNGNVGIGTDTPVEKLNVVGGIRSTINSNIGGYVDLENPLKTGETEGARWRIYNMTNKNVSTTLYTPGLHFWNYSYSTTQPNLGSKMLLTDDGNLGIGLGSRGVPTAKLDVNGNARVRQMPSGIDEATYPNVVVADANGNLAVVSRTNPTVPGSTQTIFGTKEVRDVMQGDTFYSIEADNANKGNHYFRYTGQSITLPPGKWILYNSYLVISKNGQLATKIDASNNIKSHNVWIRGIIDDNPNDVLKTGNDGVQINGSPVLVSTNISPDQKYSVATGLWFVDNTTSTDKTYYVKVSFAAFNFTTGDQQTIDVMSNYSEDYLVAIRRE